MSARPNFLGIVLILGKVYFNPEHCMKFSKIAIKMTGIPANRREKEKSGVPARFLFMRVPLSMSSFPLFFFASFSIELNEVGTPIKKPTS